MKTLAIGMLFCLLATANSVADDPRLPPVSAESLISSLPTQMDYDHWKSIKTEEERNSGWGTEYKEKLKTAQQECKQLQELIIKGKSISDYPGLLALGTIRWHKDFHRYTLHVHCPHTPPSVTYDGFFCDFDQSMTITNVMPAIITM